MRKLPTFKRTQQDKIFTPSISEHNFKIYLRLKPSQDSGPDSSVIKVHTANKVEIVSPYYSANDNEKHYNYEEVFGQGVDNNQVFQKTMIQPIENALQGYNSTVFIYGMTGAGKTYTMFGHFGNSSTRSYQEEGLVSKTIDYMFDRVQQEQNIKTQIQVSFYQIYNENIKDLLQAEVGPVNIMEDPVRGVFLNGVEEVNIEERGQAKDLIMFGIERRAMNSTKSNEVSSRSHAILQFTIRRYYTAGENAQVLESKFFMIDLAGNQKTSSNESKRFIQGVNINKSLLTLGKCLSILSENKNSYVPFRDSKLTRILKESLGGNSKTVMIACVSCQKKFYQETLNTLKYSSIAKKIKNKGVRHNVRAICKEDMPDTKACVAKERAATEFEYRIKGILAEFLECIEEKSKIDRIVEELEYDRNLNQELGNKEGDNRAFLQNLQKIDNTLKQLNRAYEKHVERANKKYHSLMEAISIAAKQKTESKAKAEGDIQQINKLKEIIKIQEERIRELQGQSVMSQNLLEAMESPVMSGKGHSRSIMTQLCGKQNIQTPCNDFRNSERSQSGNHKKLTINCHFDQSIRSTKNLNQSIVSEVSRRSQKYKPHRQIVINLNAEKPTKSNKEAFVSRLRQTEKKTKAEISQQQIRGVLEEQEQCQYELGNVEQSMLRKLRFLQRQKSLQKSNSLNRFPLRSTSSGKNGPRININN